MKILYVATVVKTHIMEFHIPYLKMLKDMGWETSVAAKNDYDDKTQLCIPYCDNYYDFCIERMPFNIHNVKAFFDLKKIIDSNGFDVIHCHTPVGAMLSRLAAIKARKKGTKVIYTAHGFHFYKGSPRLNWFLYYPVERLLSKLTDIIITINKEDYNNALIFNTAEVIYSPGVGVDVSKFKNALVDKSVLRSEYGIPEEAILLLSVGEINDNKNQETIIRALASFNNDIYYMICGDGNRRSKCESLSLELGINDRVIFTGYVNDPEKYYKAADIFVFPSKREGLGLAAIEAMAAGLPIITSKAGGIKEYSINNETGFAVDADDIAGFAYAIERLAYDQLLRERFGKNNMQAASRFDLSNTIEIMKNIYETIEKKDD